jgi:superoxide dismutase, Fe-Mn family
VVAISPLSMPRREALAGLAAIAVGAAIGATLPGFALGQTKAPFPQPPLPYPEDALAPVISGNTMGFHYGKHHKAYIDNLNKMIEGTDFMNQTLEEIIRTTSVNPNRTGIYNNAAQAWNHTFFWSSMRPGGGGTPSGLAAERLEASFGGYDGFRKEFATAAITQFGSGWAWLVEDKDKKLRVMKTGNADTPVVQGLKPLLTIDVWEHAYYLDYQNRRPDYVNAWLDKLANWDFVAENLKT